MKKLSYIVLLFLPFLTFGQIPEPVSGTVSFEAETIQDTTYGVFAMIQSYDEPTAVWTWPGVIVEERGFNAGWGFFTADGDAVITANDWYTTKETRYYLQIGRRYPMIEGIGEILYSMNIPRPIYKEIEESDFLMFKARK